MNVLRCMASLPFQKNVINLSEMLLNDVQKEMLFLNNDGTIYAPTGHLTFVHTSRKRNANIDNSAWRLLVKVSFEIYTYNLN